MPATVLMLVSIVAVTIAYFTYGSFVARRLDVGADGPPTPAHTHADGVDFVASSRPVVLGHHFASIAGAGPIVGPIVAVAFGWLPAFLWILCGVIFFGAVHDFTTLTASVRHDGRTIGDIVEDYVGVPAKLLFILFAFAALMLVVGVFANIVATAFVNNPAVATTSGLFIAIAVAFGVATRSGKVPLPLATVVGLALVAASVWFGEAQPLVLGKTTWIFLLLGYIAVAAIAPVWVLLQPRDYLNSYLLYAMLGAGVLGLFVARPTVQLDAFTGFSHPTLGFIFPILFITVACGAISGFHSLVASGTTSKQLDRESDAKFIGYGGMLLEGVLAVLALLAAGVMSSGEYAAAMDGSPIAVFSAGVGGFMSTLGVPLSSAQTFVALAVSAFALTSLDTCTRLARLLIGEFFTTRAGRDAPHGAAKLASNRYVSTGVVVVLGGTLCLTETSASAWPVFGAANQLLAALALLAVATWLAHLGKRIAFVVVPMTFMFGVTLVALGQLLYRNFQQGNWLLTVISASLLALSFVLLALARGALFGREARST